jgi:hypothetical protein
VWPVVSQPDDTCIPVAVAWRGVVGRGGGVAGAGRAETRAVTDHSTSLRAAEQLGHELLVRHCARPTSGHPLIVCLERGIGFGRPPVFRRGVALERAQPPVFKQREYHGGLATEVNEVVVVVIKRGL